MFTTAICIALNNSLISKIYFPMSFLLKNYSLVEVVYLFIRCKKTIFFLWNTNNTNRNGVNKQKNTHQTLLEGKCRKWGGGGGGSNYEPGCFWSYFLTVQEKQVMASTLFWTWDLSRNRNYKYFTIKLSTILLDVHDSLEKLGTIDATSSTGIISAIYKFRL